MCDAIRFDPEVSDARATCTKVSRYAYRNRRGVSAEFCTLHAKMAEEGSISPARKCISEIERQRWRRRSEPLPWSAEWRSAIA